MMVMLTMVILFMLLMNSDLVDVVLFLMMMFQDA